MGMRSQNINMTTKVKRKDLLKQLEKNLAQHTGIVVEARAGYIKQAKEALAERLNDLANGKTLSLSFHLSPPQDYSEVYKSCIQMLQWNTEEEVVLTSDEFRQLVEDKWDWTYGFYNTNAQYSKTAAYFGGINASWKPEE